VRVHLTCPCPAAACPTVVFTLPDVPAGTLRTVLRRVLPHAEPFVGGAAEAAGAGLLARLLLPLAIRALCRALDRPGTLPDGVS
jgi:hypothetical protein